MESIRLDLGCGPSGSGNVNVDIKRFKQKNFIRADAHHLPFQPQIFDFIQMYEVLEHVNFPYDVLVEVRRCLKSGGELEISIPNVWYWKRWLRWIKRKNTLFSLLRTGDHKQAWDVYDFYSLAVQTELQIRKAEFWNRYGNEGRSKIEKAVGRIIPSNLGKYHLRILLIKAS